MAHGLLKWILGFGLLWGSFGYSGGLRVRIREHFDWYRVKYPSQTSRVSYFGMSNTLNVWYEEPFDYAFGLALMPILGSAKATNGVVSGTNEKIRLWNLGVELKYFLQPEVLKIFVRAGLGVNFLDTRAELGTFVGASYYLGLGYEFQIWKLGISPEVALRHVLLEQGANVLLFTPSLGIHFYIF